MRTKSIVIKFLSFLIVASFILSASMSKAQDGRIDITNSRYWDPAVTTYGEKRVFIMYRDFKVYIAGMTELDGNKVYIDTSKLEAAYKYQMDAYRAEQLRNGRRGGSHLWGAALATVGLALAATAPDSHAAGIERNGSPAGLTEPTSAGTVEAVARKSSGNSFSQK